MTRRRKRRRQERILKLVKEHRVPNQEVLRDLLAQAGFEVGQSTLSRDIRDLRLVKVPVAASGKSHYTLPEEWDHAPPLESVLPALYVSAEVVGNLAVVRTLSGAAQAVASGIDWEEFEGLAGSIAGDDTVLLILKDPESAAAVVTEIESLANR